MRKSLVVWFSVLGCLGQASGASGDATAVCLAMVNAAAHNVNISTSSSQYLSTLFDNYCKSDGSTKQSSWDASLAAVIEDIPTNLTFGSKDASTAVSNFCRNYASTASGSSASYSMESKVVEKALESANQCLLIASKGTSISYRIQTPTILAINFDIGSGNPLHIRGVTHNSSVTCQGSKATGSGPFSYSTGVGQVLSSDFGSYTITCTREASSTVAGKAHYGETGLEVDTNAGSFNVYWPQETVLPIREASHLQAEIDALTKASQTALNDRIAAEDGMVQPYTSGTRFILSATCPAGWTSLGAVGIIMAGDAFPQNNPFTPGAALQESPSWHWIHPALCKR